MRKRLVVALAACLGALVASAPAGGSSGGVSSTPGGGVSAGGAPGALVPLPVHDASLTQAARSLVWHVRLEHPFSPSALERDGRTLCLLIERVRPATVVGQLCVKPPLRGHRDPQLVYARVTAAGPGAGHAISATVTRSSRSELTATFEPSGIAVDYRPLRWQVLSSVAPASCVSGSSNPEACTLRFPGKPALAPLHTPQLVGCTASGPPFVYGGPSNRRVVALTFDDGPWPDTPQFLDVLERKHVHATFFQIGEQVSTYGQAVDRRMLADGDMIGDHTWSHADVSGGGSFAAGQISQTAAAIRGATGFTPCLFRAPGGSVGGALIAQARSMGFTTIQWDIDPRDWARPGVDAIYGNVVANAHNGAIVIQHDGGGDRSETLAALPREIDALRARGYEFVTVTELLGIGLVWR